MKRSYLITLAAALVIAAFWLAHEVKNKPSLPQQSTHHQNSPSPTDQPTSSQSSNRRPSPDKLTTADWAEAAADLKNRSKQIDKFKPSPALDKRFKQLSKSELIATWQTIFYENLDGQDKVNLQRYLLTLFIQIDPSDFCLNGSSFPLSAQSQLWWERFALAEWVRHSPTDAIAWFESTAKNSREPKQITALNHNVFSALIVADFEQAKARYLATPEDQRLRLIQNFDGFGTYWTSEDFKNHNIAGRFAEIARLRESASSEHLIASVLSAWGEQDSPAGFSRIQDSLKDWKKGKGTHHPATTVADYLDKISATPREQELCLDQVVHKFKYYNRDDDLVAFRMRFAADVQKLRTQTK